jgi:transcriptional regulator with GAF, ATPase, and Fis domain
VSDLERLALLEAVLRRLTDGVVAVSAAGKITVVNDEARRLLGVEVFGVPLDGWESHFGVTLPDGRTPCPPERNPLRRAFAGEEVRDDELVLKNPAHPEGLWVRGSAAPLFDGQGRPAGAVLVFRDATAQRAREEAERAQAARRLRLEDALLKLSRSDVSATGELEEGLGRLLAVTVEALGVARAGIWLYADDRRSLRLAAACGTGADEIDRLDSAAYPAYLKALSECDCLAADDAVTDPRTSELAEAYLRPLGIGAMLDAPVFVEGRLRGVLCHEHVGGPRAWSPEERTFAVAAAGRVSRALGEWERRGIGEELRVSEERRHQLEEQVASRSAFGRLVGKTPAIQEVYKKIRLAAQQDVTVLITGESGTGKELVAASVHELSPRVRNPFVAVNCAALPEALLESELFGHVKGAFTGAVRDKAGLFQAADGGTLFLDEVGDMPAALQVKVLRALQERVIRPVGDGREIRVDVRLVAATNRPLADLVATGRMREDFYYRIRVFEIALPPLRERRADIPLLLERFLIELGKGSKVEGISPAALRKLLDHPWPGNIRELRNALEHALVTARDGMIMPADLPVEIRGAGRRGSSRRRPPLAVADRRERARLEEALRKAGGNRTKAAELLGMSRVTLWHKIKRLGIDA